MCDYYFCEHKHDIYQIKSNHVDQKCPICNRVMTFGRYTSKIEEGLCHKCSVAGCDNIGTIHKQRGIFGILLCERHKNSA